MKHPTTKDGRWTLERAGEWYDARPWLVGCNYTPRSAINQIELWQEDGFAARLKQIREELTWASQLGFNSIRLFLHDLVWRQDPAKFRDRLDRVLGAADQVGIGSLVVFFDSCWYPFPYLGRQREPEPGVHNPFWAQSPGVPVLRDPRRFAKLKAYVTDVVGHFRDDPRIHGWDLWNEPDNNNAGSRGSRDMGAGKIDVVVPLLSQAFAWARSARPIQPLTCGIWWGEWSDASKLHPLQKLQIEKSDLISFHCYGPADDLERRIGWLKQFGRPLLCTEYMSRGSGSTFESVLPVLRRHKVAAYNWGLVAGKTQTYFPWDSWQAPYPPNPPVWFHDIFKPDGKPYRAAETQVIRKLTGVGKHPPRPAALVRRHRASS